MLNAQAGKNLTAKLARYEAHLMRQSMQDAARAGRGQAARRQSVEAALEASYAGMMWHATIRCSNAASS